MNWLKNLSREKLAWLSIVLAFVTLLAVNMLAGQSLQSQRIDMTENKLFTISDTTRKVLTSLEDKIHLKLYYSNKLGENAAVFARHAERVRSLLNHYQSLSGGKLKVEFIDPEPFSDEEDRAVGAGLRGIPLNEKGGTVYFGLIGSNLTDDQEVIPFMGVDRQNFLEFDLTKMIYKLSDPKRKTIGVLSPLPLGGAFDPRRGKLPSWVMYQQLLEFFDVEVLKPNVDRFSSKIDLLLVVAPDKIPANLAYAVDQFALTGKPVVMMVDPYSEVSPKNKILLKDNKQINGLLNAWGVKVDGDKVLGDLGTAQRVQYAPQGTAEVVSYVAWQNLDGGEFDPGSGLFSNIKNLIVATPGHIEHIKGATTKFTPLIKSTDQAMLIDVKEFKNPDPLKILETYLPGNKRLVMAAQLSGKTKSAFAKGAPKPDPKAKKKPGAKKLPPVKHVAEGNINVIVMADADMIHDHFWAQAQNVQGRTVVIPKAGNLDFLLNALESLSGGGALSGLRGRGVETRPFEMVKQIRRQAEQQYRKRQQVLQSNLVEIQKQIQQIQNRKQIGSVLKDEDKKALEESTAKILQVRRELREVQRSLRADIDALGTIVKFVNIAGVPILIAIFGIIIALVRRRRKSAHA